MSDEQYRPQDVHHYPLHSVIAIVPPSAATGLIAALEQAGIASNDIDIAKGDADAQRIDDTATGFRGWLMNALPMNEEFVQRQQYVEAMRQGDPVIRVRLADENQKQAVSEIIADHGGHYINYYGRWVVESLRP